MWDDARGKPFRCDKCHYMTNRSFDLRRHQQRHDREKPLEGTVFKCNVCEFVTKWKRNMGRHMQKHKRQTKSVYEMETEANQSEDQAIEEYIVEVIEGSETDYDEESVANDESTSLTMLLPTGDINDQPKIKPQKKFKCDLCRYTSNRAFDLRRHKQTHFRIKVVDGIAYKCSECNFITKWKRNMRRHMRKHEEPVEEEACKEIYEEEYEPETNDSTTEEIMVELINAEILNSDVDMETINQVPSECSEIDSLPYDEPTPEKRFKCNQCDYESKRSYDLRRHEQTHTKIKPIEGIAYQCNVCNFITKWKRNMRRHMEKHKPNSKEIWPDDEFVIELKSDIQSESIKVLEVEEDSEILPSYWIALPSSKSGIND